MYAKPTHAHIYIGSIPSLMQSLTLHIFSFISYLSRWDSIWKGFQKSGPAHPRPRWHWGDEGGGLRCGWRSGTCPDSTRWKRPETGRAGGEDSCHDGQCRFLLQTCTWGNRKLNSCSYLCIHNTEPNTMRNEVLCGINSLLKTFLIYFHLHTEF